MQMQSVNTTFNLSSALVIAVIYTGISNMEGCAAATSRAIRR